jgi:hypothetical protein
MFGDVQKIGRICRRKGWNIANEIFRFVILPLVKLPNAHMRCASNRQSDHDDTSDKVEFVCRWPQPDMVDPSPVPAFDTLKDVTYALPHCQHAHFAPASHEMFRQTFILIVPTIIN